MLALSLRATSEALLGEILDAWFAAEPSRAAEDRASVARLAGIEGGASPALAAAIVPGALMPELAVEDGRAAIEFYKAAFAAVELHRVGGEERNESVVCKLAVGDASFWVADASPEDQTFGPTALGGGTVRMMLLTEDPDALLARAVAAGAEEIAAVEDGHGWRVGKILDPFGHQWEIARPPYPWPPAGEARRGQLSSGGAGVRQPGSARRRPARLRSRPRRAPGGRRGRAPPTASGRPA